MKKLLLMSLLVIGASYATQAQRRGNHYSSSREPVYEDSRYGYDDRRYRDDDDDCDDDRRGRGHYKKYKKHGYYRDYRRDDCRERVVVVRPRYPYPPPPPPLPIPRRRGISGVIVFNH